MNIALLAGGRSPEHDISVASARQVLRHLDRGRFTVWPVFLDPEGGFWPAPEPVGSAEDWLERSGPGPMRPGRALDWLLDEARVQVVFPVLHGPFGEDGTVQGMLELYDLPFVGSGCAASAVAMDKLRTRRALLGASVPMPRVFESPHLLGEVASESRGQTVSEVFAEVAAAIGAPFFAKVDCSGSSRGVQRVADLADFRRFVVAGLGSRRRWFAEELVHGEEITVAVLEQRDGTAQPLPAIGIYPRFSDHFDERAKYEPGACEEIIPPRGLSAAQLEQARELALACHRELGCAGMSRTDMIYSHDGPKVLEVNTIPGLTQTSLLPRAAAAAGYTFAQLLDHLLDLAVHRAGLAAV